MGASLCQAESGGLVTRASDAGEGITRNGTVLLRRLTGVYLHSNACLRITEDVPLTQCT
jgi:hypothetical protein